MLSRSFRAIALATAIVVPLAGCAGLSSFGSNKLAVAEISDIGSYTAETALAQARATFRNNDFGKSAAFYKRAVELSPGAAEAYVGLSASYDRLGRFDLSDRVYAALYKLTGATVQYHNNVGYSYLLRGEISSAMTSFKKAEELDPGNLVVANNIDIVARAIASGRG